MLNDTLYKKISKKRKRKTYLGSITQSMTEAVGVTQKNPVERHKKRKFVKILSKITGPLKLLRIFVAYHKKEEYRNIFYLSRINVINCVKYFCRSCKGENIFLSFFFVCGRLPMTINIVIDFLPFIFSFIIIFRNNVRVGIYWGYF